MINITKIAVLAPPFNVRNVVARVTRSTFMASYISTELAANSVNVNSFNMSLCHKAACESAEVCVDSEFHTFWVKAQDNMVAAEFDMQGINSEFKQYDNKLYGGINIAFGVAADSVTTGGETILKGINL